MQQPDFTPLAAKISYLSEGDAADVRRAYDFAVKAHEGQMREDGSPYVLHVIAVAEIMALWNADRDALVASLLHDSIEDTAVRKEDIAEHFGRKAALLVEGITKFTKADLSADLPLDRKIETLRKLFDVMRIDIRSILIKLADRLHNVRTIDSLPTPERRRRFALETLNVYYKIAYHLGMRELRRHFAEHCVPHAFDDGSDCRRKRDMLCLSAAHIVPVIEKELKKNDDSDRIVNVFFTPRNLLVFREKSLARGGNPLLQDAFSISVIVRTEEDCYHLLKTLHTLYRPVSGQFRDFIAAPSDSGYRSLHTHVTLRDGVVINMRVYTPDMYEQSMLGLPHLLFRSHAELPSAFDWLKRTESLDLLTRESSGAFWEALESDILRETISVIVDRRRMSLPKGATALDAAYALYNERAVSAGKLMVNGRSVPGREILREDDDVHVTLEQGSRVMFDWLQMICTRHARLLIVEALKRTDKTEKISLGASLLQKELDHYNKGLLSEFSRHQCGSVAAHFRRETFDQVLSMIGEGVIRARDVVFFLFPDGGSGAPAQKSGGYAFRLYITAAEHEDQDVLSALQTVLHDGNVSARSIHIREGREGRTSGIYLSGACADRLAFADFVESLERQEWVSKTETMLSTKQRAFVIFLFAFAFGFVFLDLVLFPAYQEALTHLSFAPRFLIQSLPLLPIFILNYYLLRLLRNYVVRMRSELWYLGIGLLLNVVGLMLLVLRILLTSGEKFSLLPLITIFVLSLVYMGYRFFEADALFEPFDRRTNSISEREWTTLRKRKIAGYLIRIVAVIIWGIEPIYIRYTAVNGLSPFLRTFLLGIGVVVPSVLFYIIRSLWSKRLFPKFKIPYDAAFITLVIGQVGYMYFKNASLIYTTGTNLLLFNNFSPVIGLTIAGFLWRKDIPYLRQTRTMFSVFILAMLAGLGSSLLVYHTASQGTASSVWGDALAMVSTFFDVIMTIGQIQYIKYHSRTNGMLLNIHIFFFVLLCMAPLILLSPVLGLSLLQNLTMETLLLGLGIGLFVGIGQFLNYEAFKRIDGYLAFMMFNLSIFITFNIEAFIIHSVRPTLLLMASGIIIIGASVAAELINSRCQKQGL